MTNASDRLRCLLAVGSNVGDRERFIDEAACAIDLLSETAVLSRSGLHTTTPVGGPAGQGEFLNGAVVIETEWPARQLLGQLQAIEKRLGRERRERWSARPIDLDLLLAGDQVIETADLTIPHPRMSYRPFVLAPAVEVAGDWQHPLLDATLDALWAQLRKGDDGLLLYGGNNADRQWHVEQICAHFANWQSVKRKDESCWLAAESGAPSKPVSPKLALQLREKTELPRSGLPTLTLPAKGREPNLTDAIAAVEGIWPALGRAESTV